MKITFLGHTSCVPDVGADTSCLLVNDCVLFDTGWAPVLRLQELGIDPLTIAGVVFSHMHQDHYLGLAQIMFIYGLRGRPGSASRSPTIAGPGEHLEEVVKACGEYLQFPRFPECAIEPDLRPLKSGDVLELAGLRIEAFAVNHVSGRHGVEPALAYRVRELATGAQFAFSGDTHPYPQLAEFARDVPLLIHDGAHTPPEDGAAVARDANVGRLVLTHSPEARSEELLARARPVFPITDVASQFMTIEL